MAKLTLNNINSRYASVAALNDNFDLIETALENTLSRDGTTPNTMSANLDMNSKDLLNVGTLNASSLIINGSPVSSSAVSYTGVIKETQTATSGQTVFTLTEIQYDPLTNNLSVYIDGVYQNPSTYTETSSSVVTMSTGVHVGAVVDFVVFALNDLEGAGDAANITYSPAGAGAVTTTVQTKLRESVSVKDFGAVGDGVTDDTAAIQAAIDANVGGAIHIPAGQYLISSQLSIASPTYSANESLWVIGDGPQQSVIHADGDFTALFVQDQAGHKGGITGLGFKNVSNTYSGGGVVVFNSPNSVGINLQDVFQFSLDDVIVEQFGTGLLISNEAYWSEGTFAKNFYALRNYIGVKFLRVNGTESFSHTQMYGLKIQIPKDNATGNWGVGMEVRGNSAGVLPAQIYNAFIQGNMWTGDGTGTAGTLGKYLYLADRGRIDTSFVALSFERYGKIQIDDGGFITRGHTFLSSLDPTQITFEDNSVSNATKFRSQYRGNLNYNLVNMSVANWQDTGVTATMRQGMQDNSATGFQFGVGTGLSFPFVTSLNSSGNGFYYGTTPDYEDNITWRFKVDQTGRLFPRLTTAYLDATSGASTSGLSAGTIKMRTDTARAIDLTPVWVGIGPDDTGAPLQVIRAAVTASRPSSPGAAGQMFFDTTLNKPIWWNGSNWVDATGATV